ncbi:MAG: hypothetical protein ACK5N4_12820 [Parabacteroides gordonii]|uniref:hypothetical protein n=1 Tax=Parabacteroides gordonii TaxID=574930 RepID=UPI003A86BC72
MSKNAFSYMQDRSAMPAYRTVQAILEKKITVVVRKYKDRKKPLAAIFSDVRCGVMGDYSYIDPDHILQTLYCCIMEEIPNLNDETIGELWELFRESIARNGKLRSILLSLEMDYI